MTPTESTPQVIPPPLYGCITYEWFRRQKIEPGFWDKLFSALIVGIEHEIHSLECFRNLMYGDRATMSAEDTKAAARYLLEHPDLVEKDEAANAETPQG